MKIIILTIAALGALSGMAQAIDLPREPWPNWQNVGEMNNYYEKAFVNSEGFGPSRILRIDVDRMKTVEIAGRNYRVKSFQLIGIVDHDPAVAYDMPGDATRKGIKHAKKRSLSKAEATAVATLAEGKDFTQVNGDDHVYLGSLRAKASCIECHEDAKKGDLLGALRYVLTPLPVPQDAPKPQKRETPKQKTSVVSLAAIR